MAIVTRQQAAFAAFVLACYELKGFEGMLMLTASDVMTREVEAVNPDTPLQELIELLSDRHVSGVPVVTGDAVVGVVSMTDVMGFIKDASPVGHVVRDVMTTPARSVCSEANVNEIADVMFQWGLHRVLVVDDGRLRGIVTTSDLARALAQRRLAEPFRLSESYLRSWP
jgi:CBS domain-containing protein